MQIQSDLVSAVRVAVRKPHKHKKKHVSYAQLSRSIHELAASSDQKKPQRQLVHHVFRKLAEEVSETACLVHHVFPNLAIYNSVDPSLAPSLLMFMHEGFKH